MNGTRVCGQCGAEVSGYSAEGLCPKCMLLGGLDLEGDEALSDSAPAKSETRSPKAEIGRLRYFGDYELLEEIARGGMGVVYKARQVTLNRIVAVKMILAGQLANAAALQRFLAEAESAANLHHPNIVAIYEVGEHGGQHYFSMEYVEGQDLAALVRQKPLPAAQAARYVRLIAEAIQYAHERGTLHRDLKPSNVLLDSFDQPRITDFGLAKQVQGDSDLTQSGQVLGTPSFMPPEQASGRHRAMGSASDIYSLGAILYHLLAGRAPFVADTAAATLRLVIEAEPVSPRLLSPSVPRDVETICLKCLEKIPTKRYPTAQELADELSRFLRGEPIQARPVGAAERLWRWCRREPVTASTGAVALLAVMLGLAGVVWQLDRAETQRRRAEAGELTARRYLYDADMDMAAQSLEEGNQARAWRLMERHRPGSKSEIGNSSFATRQDLRGWEWRYLWRECLGDELRTVATHSNEVHDVAFSPDGVVLASAGADGTVKIWSLGLARELLTLGHGGGVKGLAFSPDGGWLATGGAEGIIRFWDTATWQLHRSITNRSPVSRLAFSADNRSLAASAWDGMTVWEVATGREQAHAQSHLWTASQYPVGIAFGPDSRTVAYAKAMDTVGLWDMVTQTERLLPIEPTEWLICSFAFSHDGSKLFGAGSGDRIKVWDVPSKTLLTNLQVDSVEVKCLALSLDGQRLVAGYDDCHLRIWEVNTWKQMGTLWGHRNIVRGVAFSPDGALVATGSSDGMVKLWSTAPMVHDHDGTDFPTVKQLTGRLSADGRYLINAVVESADVQPLSYSIWDTAQLKLIRSRPVPVSNWRHVAVANDGTRLAFGELSGTITLWDGKQSKILAVLRANLELGDVLLSPDGKMLVAAGLGQIIVWDLTTLHPVYTNAFPISTISISTDGRHIAGGGDNGAVKVLELRTGREVRSFSAGRLELWNVGVSPDGKTLFTIDAEYNLSLWELPGGRLKASFSSQLSQIHYAAISTDGKRLAGSLSGGPIKVWDLETYQEVGTFWGLKGEAAGLAFLPDGETLVAWSYRDLRRWRASSWAEIKDTEKRVKSLDR